MTNITVEAINPATMSSPEAEAIRRAEAEAENFHNAIEQEETERARLRGLRDVCQIMWNHRYSAAQHVTTHLNTSTLFAEEEKNTLIKIANHINPNNENNREVINALCFTSSVSRLYRTMKHGHYFNNLPATELLNNY